MMTKIESKKRTIIKSLFILPIVAILVMIFSFTRGTEPNDLTDNFTEKGLNNKPLIITQEQDTTIIFKTVEEPPGFNGEGYLGFQKFVMKELVYPEEAAENGIKGKVFVQFTVDTKGKVRDAKVIMVMSTNENSINQKIHAPLLEKEALRVVNSSTKWEPGKNKGKPVNVQMVMPIQFVMDDEKKQEIPEEEIFFIVEDMPSFQGKGLDGFRDWAQNNLIYPEKAKEQGIEGIIYIQFIVNKKGDISKTTIMRGAGPLLDAEALRVVKSSPPWIPGKQRGQVVNVAFTFPIVFSLGETEKTKPEEKVIPVEKKKQEKPVVEEEIPEGEEIFFIVEEMPTFNGEELNGFREWIMKQLEYPEIAAKKGIGGTVYVEFVVNKKGDVKNVKIKKGADPLLDAEALRVVKSSPQWIPGKQRGQVVNVAFTFPIKFVTQ